MISGEEKKEIVHRQNRQQQWKLRRRCFLQVQMSFLCKHDLPHLLKVHIFHRACDDEEDEGSSSSENSAGEEEAVQVKKGKGLNKIMDLPSVRPDLNEVGQVMSTSRQQKYFKNLQKH